MTKKVLLVEDDPDLTVLYKSLLGTKGYEVTSATNGEEGWDKLVSGEYDVVLLDIMMPKLDGVGFLKRRFRNEIAKRTAVVVMTNMPTQEILSECFKLGVKYYMVKAQVNPQDIPGILEKAIVER